MSHIILIHQSGCGITYTQTY